MFLGLDNAGKTTLLHMLKDDRMGAPVPTQHPSEGKPSAGLVQLFAMWEMLCQHWRIPCNV